MDTKKIDIERFDIDQSYENPFLDRIKEEHIYRYRCAADFLAAQHTEPINVVDAACGHGYGYRYLRELGSYTGLDLSETTIQSAKNKHPTGSYQQEDLDNPTHLQKIDSIGAIVSFETIEHLKDPDAFMARCFNLLKNNHGYLIFSAPTVLTRDYDRYHLHDRSAAQWKSTAKKAGFTILKEIPLYFELDFKTFASSTPNNPEQEKLVMRFLLTHPKYLVARIWQWIINRKFVWGNSIYFCQAR